MPSKEEKRIYVVIPATVQVPGNVIQPMGRQIAQACHVVSKLRMVGEVAGEELPFPITTIILAARDLRELDHNYNGLRAKKLKPTFFFDENKEAYGEFQPRTAMAVLASPSQVVDILDYLPLWGS